MHSEHSARMKVAAIILWTGTTSEVCESSVVQKSSAWTFPCRDNQPSLWSFKFFKSIVDAQKRRSWRHNFRSAHCLRRSSCCWRYTWNASLEGQHGMIIPSKYLSTRREKAQDPGIWGSQAIFQKCDHAASSLPSWNKLKAMPRRHDGASNPPGAQTLSHLVKIHIYDLYLWWSMILHNNPVEKLRGCEMPESQSCSLWNHCRGVGFWCK